MDVHLDITDDRDVYVEEDNNMEVEKEVDKDVPIFLCINMYLTGNSKRHNLFTIFKTLIWEKSESLS